MKKVRVMVRSRKQTGSLRLDAANLRHRIIHEYAEIDPNIVRAIVQTEIPRPLKKSELLLEETSPSG